jgi:large subunit ribosomal protein L18
MDKAKKRVVSRKKRAYRIRKTVMGTSECPRLCVNRTLKHISAQIVDDIKGDTLVQVRSASKTVADKISGKKSDVSKIIGELIAEKAVEKGIKRVVFDRKGYPYHGRVKALAEGARSKGLEF